MFGFWSVLLLAILLTASVFSPQHSAASESSSSNDPEETVDQLKEYVVSDTRLPTNKINPHLVPAKITVISAEDIKKTGARTVQEALQYSTGIVMYNNVGNAFQHSIDLRGFNSTPVPSISVFVDGTRINEPNFNGINFDLIPFETIERIEIYPGPNAIFGKKHLRRNYKYHYQGWDSKTSSYGRGGLWKF